MFCDTRILSRQQYMPAPIFVHCNPLDYPGQGGASYMKRSWKKLVVDYLNYRRKLGFELSADASTLFAFARFAQEKNTHRYVTTDLCIRWAQTSKRQDPQAWERRIQVVRG